MQTTIECIPCIIRQMLDSAKLATNDPAKLEKLMRLILQKTSQIDLSQTPAATGAAMHRMIREMSECNDPYLHIKKQYNEFAMKLYPEMKDIIAHSDDAIETAVQLSIAGNIIDFGVNSGLKDDHVHKAISQSLEINLNKSVLDEFKAALSKAKKIMYILDNTGEIVFDRLLIEQIPTEKVTAVVRGGPVINDATMEDAEAAGLTEIVRVIDNGFDAPGTVLGQCSESFLSEYDRADLIIAKGQGNFETLNDVPKQVFFILKAKCPVVAQHLGCQLDSFVFLNSKSFYKKAD